MVFSSHLFVFGFLPLALAVYYLLPRRGRHLALTLLSYLFYGWTSPAFCLLLLVSTLIDYVCGLLIAGDVPFAGGGEPPMLDRATPRTRAQKTALLASIVSNLSLLAFFKYFDFAVENWNALASATGVPEAALARTLEVMLGAGAHVEDVSVFLGPAVSGPNYEVPAAMADEVEAALPGSRTVTAAGTPALDLRAGIARQLRELGVSAVDVDPRCTVEDPALFSHRRDAPTGRLASVVWME